MNPKPFPWLLAWSVTALRTPDIRPAHGTGRKNHRPDNRGTIQPTGAEVLLRIWIDGGVNGCGGGTGWASARTGSVFPAHAGQPQ